MEGIFSWAKAAKKRDGENPAVWHGNLRELLSRPKAVHKPKHHPAVPWKTVPQFMANVRGRPSTSARLLEWTILTCSRVQELFYTKVGEVTESECLWVVPAQRMKGRKGERREHRVPLSTRAMTIFREMATGKKPDDFLFSHPDGGHLSTGAMDKLFEIMGVEATAHGTARASFWTWVLAESDFSRDLGELALHHKIAKEVEEAYERGDGFDKRRALMEAWCQHCAGPLQPNVERLPPRTRAA